jgi:hypothetical protein
VVFDFDVAAGVVRRITFRAEPGLLAQVVRRHGDQPVTPARPTTSSGEKAPDGGAETTEETDR